jgi:Recombinase
LCATAVRRIFRLAKEGDSPGAIARELNREGIRSPQSKSWLPVAVRGVLRNPVYVGERYGVKKAQPTIVSRQFWNAVQAELDRRGQRGT